MVRPQPQTNDCLDLDDAGGLELTRPECGQRLSTLSCSAIAFVRGNHESDGWLPFVNAWRSSGRTLHALHAEAFVFGPLLIVGFPCKLGDEFHYLDGREPSHEDFSSKWLDKIMRIHGDAAGTLWLMHEPPSGTRICQEIGPIAGVAQWREAVERYAPLLTISGHDHRTPLKCNSWWDRIGPTRCINVGQKLDGPLHYCVVEFTFPKSTASLPSQVKVTGYPWNSSFEILSGQETDT